MLKNKLELLTKEFTLLKQKIIQKLQTHQQTLTETQTKLQDSNRQVENLTKENQANEAILEQLIKEFKELAEQLN